MYWLFRKSALIIKLLALNYVDLFGYNFFLEIKGKMVKFTSFFHGGWGQ